MTADQKSAHKFPDEFYVDPDGRKRYVVQEKVLLEWSAPSKVDQPRTTKELGQYVLGLAIVALILLILQEWWLLMVFIGVVIIFFATILSAPSYLKCQVTTIGIKVEEKYYYWEQFSQFWFEDRKDQRMALFRVVWPTDMRLKLLYPDELEDEILTIAGKYLLYKKPQQTSADKIREWIRQQLPPELEWM